MNSMDDDNEEEDKTKENEIPHDLSPNDIKPENRQRGLLKALLAKMAIDLAKRKEEKDASKE